MFLTADDQWGKAKDALSLNRYAYCQDNPVTYTDPDGHFPVWAVIGAADNMRKRGIPFEEEIDQAYVMKKDENLYPPKAEIKRKLKKVGKIYLDTAIDKAMEIVTDPKMVDKAIKYGIIIAKKVILKQ